MAYTNYVTTSIRDSAATSGSAGQDAAVTLPETVSSVWIRYDKTAEGGTNPVIWIRLQASIDSNWVDVPYTMVQQTQPLITADDGLTVSTMTPNAVDNNGVATFTHTAFYKLLPSNIIRTTWRCTGTTPSHTWAATASYHLNQM
jgi:hypothetical protein